MWESPLGKKKKNPSRNKWKQNTDPSLQNLNKNTKGFQPREKS